MLPKHWQLMGVINITPNSFSDGGQFQAAAQVLSHCQSLLQQGVHYLDFGAESTAPMNAAISSEDELKRFEAGLFPILPELFEFSRKERRKLCFSIDTYRASTFCAVYEQLIAHDTEMSVLWNDVSGQLDSELLEVFRSCPRAQVVLSHNLVPTRADSGRHMEFVQEFAPEALLLHMQDFFEQRVHWLKLHELQQRAMFDPCFGFAKSLEQNLYLLGQMPKLIASFKHFPWLLGISRKSMLKYLAAPDASIPAREFWQGLILNEWQQCLPDQAPIIIRLHDPNVIKMLALNWVKHDTVPALQ